jgi:hypothetical protein
MKPEITYLERLEYLQTETEKLQAKYGGNK